AIAAEGVDFPGVRRQGTRHRGGAAAVRARSRDHAPRRLPHQPESARRGQIAAWYPRGDGYLIDLGQRSFLLTQLRPSSLRSLSRRNLLPTGRGKGEGALQSRPKAL